MKIEEVTSATIDAIANRVENELPAFPLLEGAAQRFVDILYETFEESLVLSRVFVTVPYDRLPPGAAEFVRGVAGPRPIGPGVPVLALAGTRGAEPDWNDRRRSRGHAGIPLLAGQFVENIPMIAALLKQLGLALREQEGLATAIVTQSLGTVAGVFYVRDAAVNVDPQGRKVIAAQEFVRRYGVRTVFGFGGAYSPRGLIATAVLFTRSDVPLRQAERFMPLINVFKAVTMRHALRMHVFADQAERAGTA